MTEELRDKIASLRAVAPRLNASTTEAGKVIQEVEAFLESLGMGLPAEVFLAERKGKTAEGDPVEETSWLAYLRLGGKYRVGVLTRFTGLDSHGNFNVDLGDDGGTAWGSLPRSAKLASFEKLPALMTAIVDEAKRLAEIADRTVGQVRGVLGFPQRIPRSLADPAGFCEAIRGAFASSQVISKVFRVSPFPALVVAWQRVGNRRLRRLYVSVDGDGAVRLSAGGPYTGDPERIDVDGEDEAINAVGYPEVTRDIMRWPAGVDPESIVIVALSSARQ